MDEMQSCCCSIVTSFCTLDDGKCGDWHIVLRYFDTVVEYEWFIIKPQLSSEISPVRRSRRRPTPINTPIEILLASTAFFLGTPKNVSPSTVEGVQKVRDSQIIREFCHRNYKNNLEKDAR
jgi:hypothetical protein